MHAAVTLRSRFGHAAVTLRSCCVDAAFILRSYSGHVCVLYFSAVVRALVCAVVDDL